MIIKNSQGSFPGWGAAAVESHGRIYPLGARGKRPVSAGGTAANVSVVRQLSLSKSETRKRGSQSARVREKQNLCCDIPRWYIWAPLYQPVMLGRLSLRGSDRRSQVKTEGTDRKAAGLALLRGVRRGKATSSHFGMVYSTHLIQGRPVDVRHGDDGIDQLGPPGRVSGTYVHRYLPSWRRPRKYPG